MFSSCKFSVWPWTLTHDLEHLTWLHQRAKYLSQRSFCSKVVVRRDRHTRPTECSTWTKKRLKILDKNVMMERLNVAKVEHGQQGSKRRDNSNKSRATVYWKACRKLSIIYDSGALNGCCCAHSGRHDVTLQHQLVAASCMRARSAALRSWRRHLTNSSR